MFQELMSMPQDYPVCTAPTYPPTPYPVPAPVYVEGCDNYGKGKGGSGKMMKCKKGMKSPKEPKTPKVKKDKKKKMDKGLKNKIRK